MRAVDTSVLVRLLVGDDAVQTAAAEDFVSGGAWVSHVTLVEAVWVLQSLYNVEKKPLISVLEELIDHASLAIQEPDVVRSALSDYRQNSKVSFSDCLIVAIAKRTGNLPVGTFDRAQAKLAGAQRI